MKWLWHRPALIYYLGILFWFQLGGAVYLLINTTAYDVICWISLITAGSATLACVWRYGPSPWRHKPESRWFGWVNPYLVTGMHCALLFALLLTFGIQMAGTYIPMLYHLAVASPATVEATVVDLPSSYRSRRACEGQVRVDVPGTPSSSRLCNVPEQTWQALQVDDVIQLQGTRSALGLSVDRIESVAKGH